MTTDKVSDAKGKAPWYGDGLQFSCTMCGNCCSGPPGAVWFDEREGQAMAEAIGLKYPEFVRRYARRINGRMSLNERLTGYGHDCVFLDRDSKPGVALCKVYEARPSQCSTWPFWPEIIEDEQCWSDTASQTPCPGMGSGKSYSHAEITIRATEAADAFERSADPDW